MMRCTISRSLAVFGLATSLIGMLWLSVGMSGAAEATPRTPDAVVPDKPVPDDEQKLLRVYALRYVDGQCVLDTVPQVFPDARITLGPKGNQVIVHASRAGHAIVEELIKALDVPPKADKEEAAIVVVYSLKHLDPQTFVSIARMIAPDAQLTMGSEANQLIVFGLPSAHETVKELLQKLDAPPQNDEEDKRTVEVYSLKHVDVKTVAEIASEVIPDAMMTFEHANKQLIAYASASDHERLREFVKRIDVLPEQEEQFKVFNLIHAEAAPMAQAVSEIIDTKEVKLAVDTRTNSLMAVGPESTLNVIEALLLRLDEPEHRRPEETFRVRIVWFAEGSPKDEAAKPDEDLQAVQAELSRIGVGPFQSMGQVMVNTAPGGEFQIGCSARLGDDLADLKISGALDLEHEKPLLEIEINAMAERNVGDGTSGLVRLVELGTEIAAPLGHCVVLGVTPVQEKTLAFAVQVRSEESITEDNANERRRAFFQQMKRQAGPKKE